jgi:hypothetical protein
VGTYNPSNTSEYGFWKFLYGNNDPRVATGLDWNQDAKDGILAILAGKMSVAAYSGSAAYTAFTSACSSGGNLYLCIAATTGNAPPNATYWLLVGPVPAAQSGLNWRGAWNSGATYAAGDLAVSGGVLYVALTGNTNSAPPNANWQVLAMTVVNSVITWRGAWSSSTNYAVNDAVSDGGNAYIAVAPNTNSEPPNSNWNLLASKGATGVAGSAGATGATGPAGPAGLTWRGPWNSSTAYVANDAVSDGGSSYVCLTPNTNDEPPSANWAVLASKGSSGVPSVPYPIPVIDVILGDADPGTHIHLELQVSTDPTFATTALDVSSVSSQANWYYDNGSAWTAWPAGGVLADYTWGQDSFGQHVDSPTNATGFNWMYAIPSGLVAGTTYYTRWRQWDVEGQEWGRWHYGSLRV